MDYNKRRWLDRRNEQQEEQPRDEYELTHSTYFSNDYGYIYIADVKVYSKHTLIKLYIEPIEEEFILPFWAKLILKILGDKPSEKVHIGKPRRITHSDNLPGAIQRMVVDYEIPLYQKWMAEQMDEELKIDYAAELGKRRQRLVNIDQEPQQQKQISFQQDYEINDYLSSGEEENEEQKKEKRIQELAARDGVSPEKYRNLLPFQSKKSG